MYVSVGLPGVITTEHWRPEPYCACCHDASFLPSTSCSHPHHSGCSLCPTHWACVEPATAAGQLCSSGLLVGLALKPGFHSNARNASTAMHAMHWQPWLAASIEHSYWLALAFVAWKIESVLSLCFLAQRPLASAAWLTLAYFCFFFACVIFLHLLCFLCTFYFAYIFFLTQDLACVACV